MMDLFGSSGSGLKVRSVSFGDACHFVKLFHRHCKPPVGHKFSLGCFQNGQMVGVAICGRPVSRVYDDGVTLEITRLATNGTRNACSKLYAEARKYAQKIGYKKIITYTLMSESGASLRAANFTLEAENVGGKAWSGRRKFVCPSGQLKRRWVYKFPLRPKNDKIMTKK